MSATTYTEKIAVPKEAVEKLILELKAYADFEFLVEEHGWRYERVAALANDLEKAAGLEPAWYYQVETTDEEYATYKEPIQARAKEIFDEWLKDLAGRNYA
jgi:hypothetical protein